MDAVPAASLMVPRVEVDLSRCESPIRPRTAVTITNVDASSAVAHVTLWTDWGIPVFTFDLFLTGFDQVDLDLEALVCDGVVPTTGPGISPLGSMSDPVPSLPVCGDVLPYDVPILPAALAHLQAALTGEELVLGAPGQCAGSPRADGIARAYLTVDLVEDCSLSLPTDAGYFETARDENILAGAAVTVDGSTQRSLSVLHLETQPLLDLMERSFYGRYGLQDAGAREPLPSRLALVYQNYDAAPLLQVWREVGRATGPVPCGTSPQGFPAPVEDLLIFDFDENPVIIPIAAGSEMIDVNLASLSGAPTQGWVFVEGSHPGLADLYTSDAVQTWATIEGEILGGDRVTVAPATLDSLCPELRIIRQESAR